MSITSAPAFRRRAGGTAIIAFFCLLLASTLLEPTDSHANSDQLRAAAAHPAAMQASAWCEILAGMLAPVVVLTLMHIVRRRGVVLAHIGGILGIEIRPAAPPISHRPIEVYQALPCFRPTRSKLIQQSRGNRARIRCVALAAFGPRFHDRACLWCRRRVSIDTPRL